MPKVMLREDWPAERWERNAVDATGEPTGKKIEFLPGVVADVSAAQLKALTHHVKKGTLLVFDEPAKPAADAKSDDKPKK